MAELVVFYSLTGKSRQVAEWLAAGLKADIDEIVEQRPRGMGFRGIFRSGLDSLFRLRPSIRPMAHREGIFDRIILACPGLGRPHGRAGAHLAVPPWPAGAVARPGAAVRRRRRPSRRAQRVRPR